MKSALLFVPGAVFGVGFLLSGMSNPQKVLAFLDVAGGEWDPSLMFVMVGAIGVFALLNLLIHRRVSPLLGGSLPGARSKGSVTPRLLIGAALFGVGWGLGGICPGPALTDVGTLDPEILVFVGCMLVGMLVAQRGLGADAPAPARAVDPGAEAPQAVAAS